MSVKPMSQIKEMVYSRFLASQRLLRLINSEVFERVYAKADVEQKKELITLIEKGDLVALRTLVQQLGTEELEHKPMMELRKLGRRLGVENYHTLPKTHLIEEIRDAIRTTSNITSDDEAIHPDVRS